MDGREIGEDLSCPMGSARSRDELFTDSLEGVGFPSSSRFGSSQPPVCSKSMGTPISHERTIEVSSEEAYCAKDRLAPCSVPQEAEKMCGSMTLSDCGRAAMAEIESQRDGSRVAISEVEFSSDCPKCHQDVKIPAASIKEGLGVRFDDDLAVPRNNAVLPSDNAGDLHSGVLDVDDASTLEKAVVDDGRRESCPLYSDDACTPLSSVGIGGTAIPPIDTSREMGTVVTRVPDLRDRRARDRLSFIIGTGDDKSQFDDKSVEDITMDEFGYIGESSDSYYDEFSVDESEVSSRDTGIAGIVDVQARPISPEHDAIGNETHDRKIGNRFESQTVDFTETADFSGRRPRRKTRRPRKYADYSTQFANTQYIRRIRREIVSDIEDLRLAYERPSFAASRSESRSPADIVQAAVEVPKLCFEYIVRYESGRNDK